MRDDENRGKGQIPPDARRALGGTDRGSGPIEDDESMQEERQKLVEENRKLIESGNRPNPG